MILRKELGKWLMDIAKYIAAAVILSSVFGEAETWILYIGGSLSVIVALCCGLFLVTDKPLRFKRKKNNNSRKKTIMGALFMFGLIIAIALGGTAYFYHQDKKEEKRHAKE